MARTTSDRRPSRLTIAHFAMITAGLATFVTVGSVLRDRQATVEVMVLSADAAVGTSTGSLDVLPVSIPADARFLELMLRPGQLPVDQALGRSVRSGEPLLRSDLVAEGAPSLTRTATVPVEPALITGLGLVVGDRVDVIASSDDTARFVLVDVRVSRLPQSAGPDGLLSGPSSSFVTLEVDDAQALRLIEAQGQGAIELIRSTGAPSIDPESWHSIEQLVVQEPPTEQTTPEQTSTEQAAAEEGTS